MRPSFTKNFRLNLQSFGVLFFLFFISNTILASHNSENFESTKWNTNTSLLVDSLVDFIDFDTIVFQLDDCAGEAEVCLGIPLAEFLAFEVLDNGAVYSAGLAGCDFDTLSAYTYSTLFGQGAAGPYFLDSWNVNGMTFMGEFADIDALVDSMNLWDPTGMWVHVDTSLLIVGGDPTNVYSDMDVTVISINAPSFIGYNFGLEAQGTRLRFDVGFHEVIVNDPTGTCSDTFAVIVNCLQPDTFIFDIDVGDLDTVCLDFSELLTSPDSVYFFCPDSINPNVDYALVDGDACVSYFGAQVGSDTICVVACDEFMTCDTTIIIVNVSQFISITPETILDTILIDSTITYCIDTTELPGDVNSIVNFCENQTAGIFDYQIDTVNLCITFTGVAVGVDSVCIEICDTSGLCDTTYYIISVIQPNIVDPPTAEDDSGATTQGTAVIVNVLGNDTIPDNLIDIFILPPSEGGVGPNNGTATIDNNGNITYTPDPGFCDGFDSITYVICNPVGCDTAIAVIFVTCDEEEFEIFNGFSPNGDNLNDTFIIRGLDQYPDHELCIFNRWGNRVLLTKNYQNDWGGTWEDSILPDGTYFYVLDLGNGEEQLTGYVQIHR